ncbi:hypothetical protein BYT27DRAFT_7226613 [Phlegmacium glaucopus]|nr:hypothetical protein BYT27DRAFT_7226613 [Phlegmacium glaucopus]
MIPSKVLWDVVSQPFKRSQGGLFQGKTKQYGNNVPFSKHKTRRTWLPNVQQKRLPSEIMGDMIRVKLTTRALKTIKKKGGIDNYLKTSSPEILGHEGMRLRSVLREAELKKRGKLPPTRFAIISASERQTLPTGLKSYVIPSLSLETARLARFEAAKSMGKHGSLARQCARYYRMVEAEGRQ